MYVCTGPMPYGRTPTTNQPTQRPITPPTQVLSAKMAAILTDMTVMLQEDPGAKFVIFSQVTYKKLI